MKPGSMWMLALVLCLALASCAPASAGPGASPAASQATLAPAGTRVPTGEPLSSAIPAIEDAGNGGQLVVISSLTGNVFGAFKPIPLGENYNYAFSPDGRSLAILASGRLDLIDLPSWTYHTTDLGLYGQPGPVVYSPDGMLLCLTNGGTDSELRILDGRSGRLMAGAQVAFSIRNVKFTADQSGLLVYGARVDGNGVSTGASAAALFAVSDLRLLWSVDLTNIRDGVFPRNPRNLDIFQPGAALYYSPAVVFAPDGDALYAVHGDEDKLTTVDFAARSLKTVAIHERLSLLEQLLSLSAGVAHAKGMDGTTRQGVISSDGHRLYLVGTTETYRKASTGSVDRSVTHSGLQVIDVKDGGLVHRVPSDASSVWLSRDGNYLFLTGWTNADYSTPWSDVYDLASGSILKHMDAVQLMPSRLLDGAPALVSISYYSNNDVCHLASIDPATWEIETAWDGPCVSWLVDP